MATKKTIELQVKGKGIKLTADQVKKLDKNVDKLGRSAKKAAFGIHSMRVATSGLRRKLGELRNVLLVFTFALAGTIRLFKGFVAAFIEQEKVEKQLETALGRNIDSLKRYAAELQKVTIFGDEQIISGMALIGAFVREEEALKKATKATLDLAAAKGFDLRQAADLIGKTLGSTTNALSRYGIEVKGAVGSTERLESLVRNTEKAFGGMAEAMTETTGGALKQMTDAWGDLGEAIGEGLAVMLVFGKTLRELFQEMTLDVKVLFGTATAIEKLERRLIIATGTLADFESGWLENRKQIAFWKQAIEELTVAIDVLKQIESLLGKREEEALALDKLLESYREYTDLLMQEAELKARLFSEEFGFIKMEKELKGVTIEMKTFNDVIKSLHPANQALVTQAQGLADALGQAVIFGQKFGDAMVSALRAIAAEIISKLAIFLLLEAILPGASRLGGTQGFLSFLGGGNLNLNKSIVGGGSSQPSPPQNVTNVNLNINNLVGTDQRAVEDQLIPMINQALANA